MEKTTIKQTSSILFALIGFLFTVACQAAVPAHWQCFAFDKSHANFNGIGQTKQLSQQHAIKRCLAGSKQRSSCYTADSFCHQSAFELTSLTCQSNDRNGKSFKGHNCRQAMNRCLLWQFDGAARNSGCFVSHRR